MKERFGPEFPHGRIAQTVEAMAGKEFGPENLTKADIANSLNLKERDISEAEFAEISEFSVNAGAEMIQTALSHDIPKSPTTKDVRIARKNIEKNKQGMLPFHDIFHAAQTYRLSNGTKASARFAEIDSRTRYTDPQSLAEELYPVLFLTTPEWKKPVPVLLASSEGRKTISDYYRQFGQPKTTRDSIISLLSRPIPSTPQDRRNEYESLLELILIGNAQYQIKDLTSREVDTIKKSFENTRERPPEHYARFAKQVFNREWHENRRLFLDELLRCIRGGQEQV